MKLSLDWLKDWVDISDGIKETSEQLTNLGFPVEKIHSTGVSIPNIVAAKILSVEKHPNADRLQIAQVNDGKEEKQIVCGAPNIAAGQVVPLAQPGAKFSEDFEIKVSKIRGVQSNGMLCSARELGLSEDHSGIYQLPTETKLGKPIKDVLKGDVIFEVDVTPNRPDVLNHVGMARELSAVSGKKLKPYKGNWKKASKGEACKIQIKAPKACPRYMGKLIHGVKVGPSPEWMVQRLTDCGIRSINNIVDVTNYVLLEFGHPLHAFDLSKLSGKEINVRFAKDGEQILALDEVTYKLKSSDLVIADKEKPVAIAGIMGGQDTGVTEETIDILLESAVFDRAQIRQSSKRLGLKSESSIRFEKGTDVATAEKASLRAAQLILELAGGTPGRDADAYPQKATAKKVTLREKRVSHVLGQAVKSAQIKTVLDRLEFKPVKKANNWQCTVPAHRKDVVGEEDLIEEVIRVIGYNSIEPNQPRVRPGNLEAHHQAADMSSVSDILKGLGLNETLSSSFASAEFVQKFGVREEQLIPLANPLSQEETVMRPLLLPNLVKAVIRNVNYQKESVSLFEVGNTFLLGKDKSPIEKKVLSLLMYGDQIPKTWKSKASPVDFYALKGVIEFLAESRNAKIQLDYKGAPEFLHPHQSFVIQFQGKKAGWAGILHPAFAKELDLTAPLAVAEFDVRLTSGKDDQFSSYSDFPFVERDIAILVNKDKSWKELLNVITRSGGDILKEVVPFDVFSGGSIDVAKKSVAFRVSLQSSSKTLSDSEINTAIDQIKNNLVKNCGAELR